MLLRLSDADAAHLATMIEFGVQEAHEDSLSADPDVREDGARCLEAALRILREIEPDAALLDAGLRAGAPFDWDGFYYDEEDEEEIETAPLRDAGGTGP